MFRVNKYIFKLYQRGIKIINQRENPEAQQETKEQRYAYYRKQNQIKKFGFCKKCKSSLCICQSILEDF